ncbi:MAG: DUF6088 family protein [Vicinamibacterales bacterium]
MTQRLQSTDKSVLSRIYGHGRGWVFSPRDFLDLGPRTAIASALKRHKDAGRIRQLARGLYDYPKAHPTLGPLTPSVDAIARALAGRDATRLLPASGYAANLLGLTSQVPMKAVFLTDGPTRHVRVGRQEIILKRTTPRAMASAGRITGLVAQAIRFLGPARTDAAALTKLRARLSDKDKRQLRADLRYQPAWIADAFRQLTEANA